MIEKQKKEPPSRKDNVVSTENILFILGGSFERSDNNLESIVKKRLDHKGRHPDDDSVVIEGFMNVKDDKTKKKNYKNYYKEATDDDFIKFGLLPEIVGRSPIKTFVNALSKNDLIRIMTETEDSILTQYELEFRVFDIKIEFSHKAIEYVAEQAENRKTGARALVSVWENILTDFQLELPGSNFKQLIIDREMCEKPKDVLLKMLEKSPFVDYVENFRKEYGIELQLENEAQNYVEKYAKDNNIQVSESLRKLLFGASALNYMNIKGPYKITKKMLEDPKYFDKLFTAWYKEYESKEA
jgi:ATP-dependent protease Clp ATPase subunit